MSKHDSELKADARQRIGCAQGFLASASVYLVHEDAGAACDQIKKARKELEHAESHLSMCHD